jgi:hypothetical protein
VLCAVVVHGRLDGVFGQDGAVDLDRRQRQLFGDLGVLDGRASSRVLPLTHSVTSERGDGRAAAIGLELASSITPVGLTLICSFITSPQAGAPTMPVPTSSLLSNEPTLRGFRSGR